MDACVHDSKQGSLCVDIFKVYRYTTYGCFRLSSPRHNTSMSTHKEGQGNNVLLLGLA